MIAYLKEKIQKNAVPIIAIGAGFFVLFTWSLGWWQSLENKTLDYRFKIRGHVKPVSDIVIVTADEESIKALGRWPWTRSVHARLVDRLTKLGAKAIIFDILFTEPEVEHPAADRAFAAALRRAAGRVVLNNFFQNLSGKLTDPLMPIAPLLKHSRTGFANSFAETDGIVRWQKLFTDYEDGIMPHLSVAGLSVFLGKPFVEIIKEAGIPMNGYNEMLINFYGGYDCFPYYSYYKVLNGDISDNRFQNKIVLVGGTATALFDQTAVPFIHVFPGVEVHATVMSNILRGEFLRPWPKPFTFLLIVACAFLSAFLLSSMSPLWGGVSALSILAGYFFATYFLFAARFVYAEFMAPAASLTFSYVGTLFYKYIVEEKEKRHIKKTFGQYLSPRVMEQVLSDPGYLKLGGQKQNLTVLFSDIRNFTTMTEASDSVELVSQLNEYLSKMVEVVFRHDGTLDKFIGDAVMAIWGAPIPQNDHARRAVHCAIDMLEELDKLNAKWKAEGRSPLEIGIGVNTGDMIVGNMGSKEKMEYTVIGDNVNLGSRLEGLNKEYGTHIIISDATYQAVRDMVEARHLGDVKVKGKTKAVEVYAVLGKKA
ncbi:MAG: hypothetical protein A2219_01340 [Elusimicrobia bacterium RIFOXYA2_FULL_50_26]|nr:MAG: hypothetical protein A2219_01340 [Elusimicrobia bacterium RIFOXYA2_FULL_50_26]OGS24300.1 MAG: hypothetical protein A2314_07580 [Elusimicrobia bacterium RIFOXYB2_FULL_50_12]